jgi:hypothetical protein
VACITTIKVGYLPPEHKNSDALSLIHGEAKIKKEPYVKKLHPKNMILLHLKTLEEKA